MQSDGAVQNKQIDFVCHATRLESNVLSPKFHASISVNILAPKSRANIAAPEASSLSRDSTAGAACSAADGETGDMGASVLGASWRAVWNRLQHKTA